MPRPTVIPAEQPLLPEAAAWADSSPQAIYRIAAGQLQRAEDEVIEEQPVALVYNGISQAVMLATPTDLEDFALGFSLSEGILTQTHELYDLEIEAGCDGIVVNMEIAPARFAALKVQRRQLAGRTGCGLCGIDSLQQLASRPAPVVSVTAPPLTPAAIDVALQALAGHQALRQRTGAAHGAAWVDRQGHLVCLREDVGRHNALDKLIGALARSTAPVPGFALITSRASYEMVQKAASAGISALVAVSAPTGRAIRQARACGMLLIGFARHQQLVVYSGCEQLAFSPAAIEASTLPLACGLPA